MSKKIQRLLIIPARGNSKRIKNKNIKLFCGKPIINYSLLSATKSKLFNKIHVSTDSKKIFNTVINCGYKIDFMRPKKISSSKAQIIDVLRFVTQEYSNRGLEFDEIWSLSACAPLITYKDLLKASKYLKKNNNKIILPITEYSAPIEWAFKLNKSSKILQPLNLGAYKIRSQDFKKKYHDVGSFVCMSKKLLDKKEIKFLDKKYLGILIPRNKAVDIDNHQDWKIAEAMFKNNN